MVYRVAADLLVVVHFLFVVFVVFGGLFVLRWPRVAWFHLPAALWGVLIEFTGCICPLTPLEQALRQAAGEGVYGGGFIGHYITPVLYPTGLDAGSRVVLGALLLALNLLVYGRVLLRRRAGDSRVSAERARQGRRAS